MLERIEESNILVKLLIIVSLSELSPFVGSVIGFELEEELCKMFAISVSYMFGLQYVIVFGILEMIGYLMSYSAMYKIDGMFSHFVALRIVCFMDHIAYYLIQLTAWKLGDIYETWANRWTFRIAGLLFAWTLHYAHNEWGFRPLNDLLGITI